METIENRTDVEIGSGDNRGLEEALTSYYAGFQDPTISGVLKMYEEGTIEHITIPPAWQNQGRIWDIVLNKYISGKALVSRHAELGHPADSQLSIKILKEELEKGNVSTNVRQSPKYREGKESEISRLVLQTTEPVERDVTRHLHLEMALEIQNQVDNLKTENEALQRYLERLAQTNPGFTALLACELASLVPISKKLHLTVNDILQIIPGFSPNRGLDRNLLISIYDSVAGKNIFNREEMQKSIEIICDRFPLERKDLEKIAQFKEFASPIAVFESSFNVLTNDIFPRKGVKLTPFVMKKIGKLTDSITSNIVTAYVQHTPKLSLGQTNTMLSKKTIDRF